MTKRDFFDKFYPDALKAQEETGIPALAKLAQAAVESAWGEKFPMDVNTKANSLNFFGIKADPRWKGSKVLAVTTEVHSTPNVKYPKVLSVTKRAKDGKFVYKVWDYFRAYSSAKDSFDDHSNFLKSNPRYASAFGTTDPKEFVNRIAAAGYATAPTYSTVLKSIIDDFSGYLKK